jgi:hypothetical protein
MSDVSKHHAKEEWKRHYGEEPWVDLSIAWNAVGVDDFLEWPRHLIHLEVGGRCLVVICFLYLTYGHGFILSTHLAQCLLEFILEGLR